MQGDFFVAPDSEPNNIVQEEEQTAPTEKTIPKEYLPIKLSSMGKLSAPAVVHIRNYNLDEALEISLATEDDLLETSMAMLKNMMYEGFDPQFFHEEELKEIFFNIFANFWGSSLSNYYYPYEDEELTDPKANEAIVKQIKDPKKDFNPKVSIEVENVKTIPIMEKFKEPIVIKANGEEVHFRLTRVKDVIEAKEMVSQKYLKYDQQYADLINKLRKQKQDEIDPIQLAEYTKIQKRKMKEIAMVVEAATLVKYNSKKFTKLTEKITAASKIPIGFWKTFTDISQEVVKFGLNETVKVISPITGKSVDRRFQFRFMDFIQSLELQDNSEYAVSFGS